MAGGTVKRFAVVVILMSHQTESRKGSMIDIGKCEFRNVCLAPLMLGVTGLAAAGWEPAMQAFRHFPPVSNLPVAFRAEFFFQAVHGGMTMATVVFELGVRVETTGHCAFICKC